MKKKNISIILVLLVVAIVVSAIVVYNIAGSCSICDKLVLNKSYWLPSGENSESLVCKDCYYNNSDYYDATEDKVEFDDSGEIEYADISNSSDSNKQDSGYNDSNIPNDYKTGQLQYPSSNDTFKYNVYDTHIEITGYVGEDITGDLIIPDTIENLPVRVIGPYAFGGESLSRTFPGCSISSVVISDNVCEIGECAFYRCENLESVQFGKSVYSIGESAFQNTALLSVELPETLAEIDSAIFYECENLETVVYNNKLTFVSESMFAGCVNLTSFVWGSNIKYIDTRGFSDTGFTSIDIPESVEYIGESAFSGCNQLQTFVFPDTVKEIGAYCLSYCDELQSVTFGAGIQSIPSGVLSDSDWVENIYFTAPDVVISEGVLGGEYYVANPVIYGHKASTAATFAVEENLTFKPLS